MVNNKTLLGVFVVVFIIVGVMWFVRKSPDAFKRLKLPFPSQQVKVTPTPTKSSEQSGLPPANSNPVINSAQIPSGLISCSTDIDSSPCNSLPVQTVCGYAQTIYPDGRTEVHALPYNTSCHYCVIFGDDSAYSMGEVKVKALGFQNSACK